MRKFGMMVMLALMMMACQDRNAYTISGTYEAAGEGDSVSLQLVEGRKLVDLQKVPVVDGKFEFNGVADSVQMAAVTLGDAFCQLFLEPGQIKVDLKVGEMSFALGTPNNNAYESFMSDMKALDDEYAANTMLSHSCIVSRNEAASSNLSKYRKSKSPQPAAGS